MKTTAIFSAALLGASMLSYGAFAQTSTNPTIVPGSESQMEIQNSEERDNVADNPGMSTAKSAQSESETMVPGSESQREIKRAEERDAVSSGDDAMSTGAITSDDEPTDDKILVPGSGADFSPGEDATTQEGKALPDDSPESQTQ